MSTPGTAIARPSRTIIQTTVLRAAPSAMRTPISRTRAVTEYASSPYTPMQASRIVSAAANVANPAVKRSCTSARSTHSDDVMNARRDRCPSDFTTRVYPSRTVARSPLARTYAIGNCDLAISCRIGRKTTSGRRVVQLAVRGIGDDADHFDVTTLGSGEPDVLADGVACREQRASQGRRDQRHGGLPRAVVPREVAALQPREPEQIEEAGRHELRQHRDFRRCDAVGPRVVIIRRERPRDPIVRRVIHRQRGRLGPRHVAKVGDERLVVLGRQQLDDLRAHDTRG